MTKQEFLDKLNAACRAKGVSELPKKDLEGLVRTVFNTIQDILTEGESFKWPGFGSFKPVLSPAKKGRNPQTGEAIQIPEKRKVKFRAGKTLANSVNFGKTIK